MKLSGHFNSLLKLILLFTLFCFLNCQRNEQVTASSSQQSATANQYRNAYAMRACAPWDGPAVRIILTNKPLEKEEQGEFAKPYLTIAIYKSISEIADKSFTLGQDGNIGSATITTVSGDYLIVKTGKVQIKNIKPDTSVEGEYDLDFGNGNHQKGSFQAKWLNIKILCG